MIDIYLKYDNVHIFGMINAFNCINNHVISCINSMLSCARVCAKCNYWVKHPLRIFANPLYALYLCTRRITFIFFMWDYFCFYIFEGDVEQREALD